MKENKYTYWKIVCPSCRNIILVTNHKKKIEDIIFAGDITPTKYYCGDIVNGAPIKCQCGNTQLERRDGGFGEEISEREYKKIKRTIC